MGVLTQDHGLRHYFRVLWEHGRFLDDGRQEMLCRSCGAVWIYQGRRLPICAQIL